MLSDVEQHELPLSRRAVMQDVPIELVVKRKSFLGAINLCIELSGLDDKEIVLSLGLDPGHFSHLRKGKGHFPIDKINALMELCGNEAPLIWLAHVRGYGLVVLKSEAERRAEEAEARAAKAEEKARLLQEILQGRLAA